MKISLHRARFYGILDTAYVSRADWTAKCAALIEGGADIIQLRAKKESHAERVELLEDVLPIFEKSPLPLIINDDIELALKYPGLGLHVGQDDLPAKEARDRLGPERILGLSTHSLEQAHEAIELGATLDYFAIGPIFATATKPDYKPVSLELVRQVTALQTETPLFCIGGINRRNAHDVKTAGALRVVAVSDVLCAADTAEAVRDLRQVFET